MRELLEMQALVHAYRDFAECIVESIEWFDHGTSIGITFDYIWKPDGRVRADDEERLLVHLRFKLVHEFEMKNALKPAVLTDESAIGWGLCEVSRLVVQDDERSRWVQGSTIPTHHASLRREAGAWIDIVFGKLEVTEASARAHVIGGE
jgi:hypothetical protein